MNTNIKNKKNSTVHGSKKYKYSKRYRRSVAKRNRFICLCSMVLLFITIISCFLFNTNASGSTEPKTKYYTSISVNEGDNLWKVAEAYYTEEYSDYNEYIEEIKTINNMKDDKVKKGSYIVIPYYAE